MKGKTLEGTLLLKGPVTYIKQAFKIFFDEKNLWYLIKVVLVRVAAYLLFSAIYFGLYYWLFIKRAPSVSAPIVVTLSILSVFVYFVWSLWMELATLFALFSVLEGKISAIKKVYQEAYSRVRRFILPRLFSFLIVLLGFILLIVPGVVLAIFFVFLPFLVVEEDLSAINYLKKAKALVKARFWAVLGRSIVFSLFGLVITLILYQIPFFGFILPLFLGPLFILPFYLLYKDLS